MKKALAMIFITALILCGCADSPKGNPKITQEANSESIVTVSTEISTSEAATVSQTGAEAVTEAIVWDDYDSPIYQNYASLADDDREILDKADAMKYKTVLGVNTPTDVSFATFTYSGNYYLKSYYIADLHLVGYVTETNYPQDFNIVIKGTQINPDTGEEKPLEAWMDGNMYSKLLVHADDGFVIKSYVITNDFKSYPQRIEDELSPEQIEAELLKEKLAGMSEEERDEYLQEYYSQKYGGRVWEDYSDQIIEGSEWYTLEGRTSIYPLALGEHHEHMDCDSTDTDLMALGRERLEAAAKIDTLINGLAMRDLTNELPVEGWDEGYFALSEDFGDYESIMALYKNSFSPDVGLHEGYYSVSRPVELLKDWYSVKSIDINGRVKQARNLSDALESSMLVHDGTTYETGTGLYDARVVKTKVCGVLSRTDTRIEYRLCTMVYDKEGMIMMDESGIPYDRPQVCYQHSVMKLDLIDGQWLITQIRNDLMQYQDFIDEYGYEF